MSHKKKREEKALYSGILLGFEPRRTAEIREYLSSDFSVSESLSSVDWELEPREVALLILDLDPPAISGAALLERGRGAAGTKKLRMRFLDRALWNSIPLSIFGKSIDEFSNNPDRVTRLSAADWQKALDIVKSEDPSAWKRVQEMLAERERPRRLSGESQRSRRLSEQRDALGEALAIGAIDKGEVLESIQVGAEDSADSILDLIDALPVQERSLLEHDAQIFPGILGVGIGSAAFSAARGKRQVRVYVTDKGKLETKLGIDLLVYQSQYDSFILLQYKAMEYAPYPDSWSYAVDDMLEEQVRRMKSVRKGVSANAESKPNIWGMRLNGEPFYFKFCERMRPDALGRELVGGITLCLPHLEEFLASPEAKTEKGPLRVGYRNCPRYLTNTDFISLARGGWIGSKPLTTALLRDLIGELRKKNRAQVFAVVHSKEVDAREHRQSLRGTEK